MLLSALRRLDRRWVYLAVLLSAAFPMMFGVKLHASPPTVAARKLFDEVSAIPDGSAVIVSFDFEPGSEVELAPAALVVVRQLFARHCRIVSLALWPAGSTEARKHLGMVADEFARAGTPKVYGVDYVNLGYKAGGAAVLRQMGSSFSTVFPKDVDGTPVDQLPLMTKVNRFRDVAFVFSFSVGTPGMREWVNVVNTEYGVKIGGAVTGVSVPETMPFLDSGQLSGLLGGLRGAADYETLVHQPGSATAGMNVQNFVHLLILALIVLSNILYFTDPARRRRRAKNR